MKPSSPFDILGVSPKATTDEIRVAWKKKASLVHPDVGGSHESMLRLNEALEEALALATVSETSPNDDAHLTKNSEAPTRSKSRLTRDVSSFTINALPVDSWQLLTLAAAECGPIVDEEEPYLLEFMLSDLSVAKFKNSICRCDIVPEAGASTVHISLISTVDKPEDIETVRDLLVDLVNEISRHED